MHALIKAGVRLVIIFMSLQLLIYLASGLSMFTQFSGFGWDSGDYLNLAIIIGTATACAVILYFAWKKSDWLVRKLTGDIDENKIVISTNNADLINAALRIVGMVLVIVFVPKLAGLAAYRIYAVNLAHHIGVNLSDMTAHEIQQWVTVIGTILIGIWLALSGTGMFRAFTKIGNYIRNTE